MANNSITITKPGQLTTMQDMGRTGFQHLGITNSGPSDEHAFLWANKLLGNQCNSPCLEISLSSFEARFNATTQLAITGAETRCFQNNSPIAEWQILTVNPGDLLTIERPSSGVHVYLSVKGGFIAEKQFGSSSTNVREHIGFANGEAIYQDQEICFKPLPLEALSRSARSVAPRYIPNYENTLTLNLIPGYQHAIFTDAELNKFTSEIYEIGPQSNKMGYRLQGAALEYEKDRFVSEGIAFGSVQVPPDGQPIILLKDRQTIGGYPKLGCIQHLDCFQLSQRRPGQHVKFHLTSLEEAQKELQLFYDFFGY